MKYAKQTGLITILLVSATCAEVAAFLRQMVLGAGTSVIRRAQTRPGSGWARYMFLAVAPRDRPA